MIMKKEWLFPVILFTACSLIGVLVVSLSQKHDNIRIDICFCANDGQKYKELFTKGLVKHIKILLIPKDGKDIDSAEFLVETTKRDYSFFLKNLDQSEAWKKGFEIVFNYPDEYNLRKETATKFRVKNKKGAVTAQLPCPHVPGDIKKIRIKCRFEGSIEKADIPPEIKGEEKGKFLDFDFVVERTGNNYRHTGGAAGVGRT